MAKLLLYCTKAKPKLYCFLNNNWTTSDETFFDKCAFTFNGKIVAECDCNKVEEIACEMLSNGVGYDTLYYTETQDDICEKSCLETSDLITYLGQKKGGNIVGYALHLSNLEFFDKPKELRDFYKDNFPKLHEKWKDHEIKKAPQNMCKVYDGKEEYILISIRPEWLCKILNGEKTIEVRKKVLKEMKSNEN